MTEPILVCCAHGTRSEAGQRLVSELAQAAGELLDVEVREAFVDVQEPRIDDVIAGIEPAPGVSAVVVPVLLSRGFHVFHDIGNAAKDRSDVLVSATLGPDPRIAAIIVDRLAAVGARSSDPVVLAAAGSSDARAQSDVEAATALLAEQWAGPVSAAYAASAEPTVSEAIAASAVSAAVASYLLAPGYFHDSLTAMTDLLVTAPLAPDRRLVEIVADRYRDAIRAAGDSPVNES